MYIVGITGASGPIIGVRLIEELLKSEREVAAVVSDSAKKIIKIEIGESSSIRGLIHQRNGSANLARLVEYGNDDICAPPASGSFDFTAVVVAPCSMKSLASIACGYADTLIGRAADVALKEGRRCVLVPRESPLSLIHIENMLRAKRAGADIVPPVPGFYAHPQTIGDVVDFTVGKILSLLGIEHALFKKWGDGGTL